ncbi:hypothetical protein CR513_24212, partial [Mucuna pruriens]
MPPPKIETKVQGFLGRVNYITRFISQLTATCSPIFKLLQKNQKTEWNQDQGILGITSYPCPGSTKKAPDTLPDSARRINKLSLGATRCLGEERIDHILS